MSRLIEDPNPIVTILKPITGGNCICGHEQEIHAKTEPRVCGILECSCPKYHSIKPYDDLLGNAHKYTKEMEKWPDKVAWVFENIKFFRNYNNTQLVFAWWKFIHPHWDMTTEFLTPQIEKAIEADAKPESITRAARALREDCRKNFHHSAIGCKFCTYDPDHAESIIDKEYGIYTWAVDRK